MFQLSFTCKVPAKHLESMIAARHVVIDKYKEHPPKNLECAREVFDSLMDTLVSIDTTVKVDRAILDGLDDHMDAAVSKEILECLPDADTEVTVKQSDAKLKALHDDELYKFAPEKTQRKVESVIEVIENLIISVPPDPAFSSASDFYAKVTNRISYFVRHTEKNNAGADAVTSGKKAIDQKFEAIRVQMSKEPTEIGLDDIEIFQTYKFLLNKQQQDTLSQWVKQIVSAPGGGVTAASGSACSSGSLQAGTINAAKKRKKDSSKMTLNKASLLKFFA